jgi:ubiquinone biosynthesis accessory factor UbiJ
LTPSLVDIFVPLLNHLLAREDWARQRLKPYSAQTAHIEGGPFQLTMTVDELGAFRPGKPEEVAAVTITLPSDAPFRMLTDPSSIFGAARITGAANFAETLAFVFRNLRWDYEADLAGIIGDIPAHRISRLLAEGATWQRSAVKRLGLNAAEFATEESGLVTSARDLTRFSQDVDQLRDDAARLEKRISRL